MITLIPRSNSAPHLRWDPTAKLCVAHMGELVLAVEMQAKESNLRHMVEAMEAKRDHLFISYAWEDTALAEWLARKLMAEGYGVWIDRFKILGGDVWPEDIDDAIKNRSYRMIHLLSTHSLTKENPSKERQLALTLSKDRGEKFLIPLNVEGLSPKELPWQLTDIQYIPFSNWAEGLAELLNTLDKIRCPRIFAETGQALAVRSCLPLRAVREAPEVLYSNCYEVLHVPEVVQRYECTTPFTRLHERDANSSNWPCFHISDSRVLSFEPPPEDTSKEHGFVRKGGACWPWNDKIDGVRSRTIAKSLIRESLACIVASRGLVAFGKRYWYFPESATDENEWLYFPCYTGKQNRVKTYGERRIRGEVVRYALAFQIGLRDDILDGFSFQMKLRLHLTDPNGKQLDHRKALSRRKAIAGNWWNHEWLLRQEAVIWFLSEGSESFSWSETDRTQVTFSAVPVSSEVPLSLDDEYIDSLTTAGKSEEAIKQELLDETIAEIPDDEADKFTK